MDEVDVNEVDIKIQMKRDDRNPNNKDKKVNWRSRSSRSQIRHLGTNEKTFKHNKLYSTTSCRVK